MTFDELLGRGAFEGLRDSYQAKPTVALFYGANCAPCNSLKPKLREVCKKKGLRLEEFNSAAELTAVRALGIRTVPAVIFVQGVKYLVVFVGDKSEGDIETALEKARLDIS